MRHKIWNNFHLLMIGVVCIWAPMSTVITYLINQGLRPGELVLGRALFAVAALAVLSLVRRESRAALGACRARLLPAIFGVGLVGTCFYTTMQYSSMASDARNVVPYVVINYLWPLFTMLFGFWILKERRSGHLVMACVAGLLGFGIIQIGRAQEGQGLGDVRFLGGLMALAAALSWGLFSTLARRLSDLHRLEARSSMFLFELSGLLVSLPLYGLGFGRGPAAAPLVGEPFRWGLIFGRWDLVLLLALLGAGSSAVASMLWLRAIKLGGAGRTAVVSYLTPVLALAILGLVTGQWPGWYAAAGLALILAAVTLAEMRRQGSAQA